MLVAGIDECGTGALAGPIVTACLIAPMPSVLSLQEWCPVPSVNDSKKLSAVRRRLVSDALIQWVLTEGVAVGIGSASAYEINTRGHHEAWRLAIRRAWALAIEDGKPDVTLMDGTNDPGVTRMQLHAKGDARFFPIAAASILGKVYRDQLMQEWVAEGYAWAGSSGYPSAANVAWVRKHGLTPNHRAQACATALRK